MTIPWGAPHVAAAVKEIDDRFTGLGNGGTYPGHGEDPPGAGFAADFWTTDKAKHDEVFSWLLANGERLGIWYVISWRRIYSFRHPERGIAEYTRYDPPPNTASQDHKNHIHVSFNEDPPEEDMPTAREIADELATNDKFLNAVADAVLNRDGVPNAWGDKATNPNVRLKSALVEIGNDANAIRAKLQA